MPVTLDVDVERASSAAPRKEAGGTRVTAVAGAGGSGGGGVLRVVGYAGVGVGSGLLLGLGVWTLRVRRG
ncbi:hypothetical protein SMD11_2505 [Streptomyces albireticuli]|uniref:Uncharacterized protein n=1 Tax=Streptomyces albireticuli TaxID=1940 RepID=A0A1Z2L1J7_9ACTN|nr:hypothetical protein SMD11_2505 [Streptomyces albireticuli]